ncbi:MAG TPA: hypothetical protein VME47_19755 [Acetobacteraceae bacterium]|nr:hypothetical protein [Acetobacteraceae bacterium]
MGAYARNNRSNKMAGLHQRPRISDETPMEFAQAQAALARSGETLHGLTAMERGVLDRWVAAARKGGIETAEDLGFRPWPGQGTETIIGVFKSGHLLASWLVVGQAGAWAVASCGDGAVSARLGSLADALELVYPRKSGLRH